MFDSITRNNKNLTVNRYTRLICIAAADIAITVPLATWVLVMNITYNPMHPWISWADTHSNFWAVRLYASVIWHLDPVAVVGAELQRWIPILSAFMFFAFFGFAQEARKNYRSALESVGRVTGLEKLLPTRSQRSQCVLTRFLSFASHS